MEKYLKRAELLSPVGDLERLDAALFFGADAVYLGAGTFGMRAAVQKMNFDEIKNAVKKVHDLGKKIYLTCNTLPTNDEIDIFPQFIKNVSKCGIDAYIVSDIGVLFLIKKLLPDAEIHISTQAGIVNYASANSFFEMGAKRVVLAREMCIDDIKKLRDKTNPNLEIEAFVHGAMCMSFSGRCTISNYLNFRDANRGECSQPCRWKYYLMEEKRPNEFFPVSEEDEGTYILNSKDLCMINHIDKLIDAGVSSLKIEGRAKSSYYVGIVTNAYRNVLDFLYKNGKMPSDENNWMYDEVYKVSHREYSTGFYFGRPEQSQCYKSGGYIRNYDIVGICENCKDGRLYFTSKNGVKENEELEIVSPGKEPVKIIATGITDSNGMSTDFAKHPMSLYSIRCSFDIKPGSILRKKEN